MLTEVANGFMFFEKSMTPFNSGIGSANQSPSNDILEKLRLVKSHTDLVISFASQYAEETGKPFPQMLKIGLVTLIKSAKKSCVDAQVDYDGYLMGEIDSAMSDFCKKSF